jgi:hypothetical protein
VTINPAMRSIMFVIPTGITILVLLLFRRRVLLLHHP